MRKNFGIFDTLFVLFLVGFGIYFFYQIVFGNGINEGWEYWISILYLVILVVYIFFGDLVDFVKWILWLLFGILLLYFGYNFLTGYFIPFLDNASKETVSQINESTIQEQVINSETVVDNTQIKNETNSKNAIQNTIKNDIYLDNMPSNTTINQNVQNNVFRGGKKIIDQGVQNQMYIDQNGDFITIPVQKVQAPAQEQKVISKPLPKPKQKFIYKPCKECLDEIKTIKSNLNNMGETINYSNQKQDQQLNRIEKKVDIVDDKVDIIDNKVETLSGAIN